MLWAGRCGEHGHEMRYKIAGTAAGAAFQSKEKAPQRDMDREWSRICYSRVSCQRPCRAGPGSMLSGACESDGTLTAPHPGAVRSGEQRQMSHCGAEEQTQDASSGGACTGSEAPAVRCGGSHPLTPGNCGLWGTVL